MASGSLGVSTSLYGDIVLGTHDTDPLTVYAFDTVSFSDTASASLIRNTAEDTLTFTDEATVAVAYNVVAEDTLTFSDVADFINYNVITEDTLTITDEASAVLSEVITAEASDTLTFSDSARASIIFVDAVDTLDFVDDFHVGRPRRASAEDDLQGELTETFDPDTFETTQVYELHDVAEASLSGSHDIEQVWSFGQQAIGVRLRADAIECLAEDTLTFTDEAVVNITPEASDTLTFVDTAEGVAGKLAEDTLEFSDEVVVNIVYGNKELEDTLTFSDSVSYTLGVPDLCGYSPFVGGSSDPNSPTPPPSTYSPESGTEGFRLQYPASGMVTDEVVLRNPNLGEKDRIGYARINRETRGGTLIIYADPIWPKIETLSMNFSGLSRAKAFELLEFMEDHLGEDIKLIDWENRAWTGVISQPQDPIVQDGPGCQYTASFEFVGTKDD